MTNQTKYINFESLRINLFQTLPSESNIPQVYVCVGLCVILCLITCFKQIIKQKKWTSLAAFHAQAEKNKLSNSYFAGLKSTIRITLS